MRSGAGTLAGSPSSRICLGDERQQRGRRLLLTMHNQMTLPKLPRQCRGDAAQTSGLQRIVHYPGGQAGHPQPFLSGTLDGFLTAQLDAPPVRAQVGQQALVGGLARARARFANQPDRLTQRAQGNAIARPA